MKKIYIPLREEPQWSVRLQQHISQVFETDLSFIAAVNENRSCNGSRVDLPLSMHLRGVIQGRWRKREDNLGCMGP